jgi:pyruvate formate lyase activating enzyme
MSSTRGLVANTLRSSVVDGPGNRYVLFLQGCNFDCIACHNPSTIRLCDSCAICVEECPVYALEVVEGRVVFDPDLCDGCDLCLLVCPTSSSPMAVERSVGSIIADLKILRPFLSGVTVTGGEPTRQLEFLVDLFTSIKRDPMLRDLTTLVDTNGTLPVAGWRRLAPVIDGAMVDLKAASPDLHLRLTGNGNAEVRRSIRWLWRHRLLAELRLLVIEGVTDDPAELAAWAAFVGRVDPTIPVRLLAFGHVGTRSAARDWPETGDEALERAAETLRGHGLRAVSSGLGAPTANA